MLGTPHVFWVLAMASIDLKTLGAGLATIALAGVGAGVEPQLLLFLMAANIEPLVTRQKE